MEQVSALIVQRLRIYRQVRALRPVDQVIRATVAGADGGRRDRGDQGGRRGGATGGADPAAGLAHPAARAVPGRGGGRSAAPMRADPQREHGGRGGLPRRRVVRPGRGGPRRPRPERFPAVRAAAHAGHSAPATRLSGRVPAAQAEVRAERACRLIDRRPRAGARTGSRGARGGPRAVRRHANDLRDGFPSPVLPGSGDWGSPSGPPTFRPLSPTVDVGNSGNRGFSPKSATPVGLPHSPRRPDIRINLPFPKGTPKRGKIAKILTAQGAPWPRTALSDRPGRFPPAG